MGNKSKTSTIKPYYVTIPNCHVCGRIHENVEFLPLDPKTMDLMDYKYSGKGFCPEAGAKGLTIWLSFSYDEKGELIPYFDYFTTQSRNVQVSPIME